MSLLTDLEIRAILELEPYECILADDRMVADAEHAKTLKAMAEWLQPYIVERYNDWCRYVIPTQAVFALREGEMPREEKDAVLETRETPRTISPD